MCIFACRMLGRNECAEPSSSAPVRRPQVLYCWCVAVQWHNVLCPTALRCIHNVDAAQGRGVLLPIPLLCSCLLLTAYIAGARPLSPGFPALSPGSSVLLPGLPALGPGCSSSSELSSAGWRLRFQPARAAPASESDSSSFCSRSFIPLFVSVLRPIFERLLL